LYRSAFIKVIEEISEPLVRQELQLANAPQFVELITKKIRHEGRNVTAHSVTDAEHLRELFDVAKNPLEDHLTKLFTHYYPKVRKQLCVQIEKNSSIRTMTYSNLGRPGYHETPRRGHCQVFGLSIALGREKQT